MNYKNPESTDLQSYSYTRCSESSKYAPEMKYFACHQDNSTCANLNENGTLKNIEVELANRTISVSNIQRNQGKSCIFKLTTNNTWTNTSLVMLYPSRLDNSKAYIASNGTYNSRDDLNITVSNMKNDESINLTTGQDIYVIVAPSGDSNAFEISYSVVGQV